MHTTSTPLNVQALALDQVKKAAHVSNFQVSLFRFEHEVRSFVGLL